MKNFLFFQSDMLCLRRKNKAITYCFTFFLICVGQIKSLAQVAPLVPPSGGFNIQGTMKANTPLANIGDWLQETGGTGGHVLDNSGQPIDPFRTFHVTELFDNTSDIQFTGSKFNANPTGQNWSKAKPSSKSDINNAYLHIGKDPSTNHVWAAFGADRFSINGTSYIDFEFLQNTLTRSNPNGNSGSFTTAGPHGGRTVNDLIVSIYYSNGGSTVSFIYWKWTEISPGNYDYVQFTPPANTGFGSTSTTGFNVPYSVFNTNAYTGYQFVEGAIDLDALVAASIDQCAGIIIKTVFIKTKASDSETANLEDLVEPIQLDLAVGLTAKPTWPAIACNGGTTTVTVEANGGQSPYEYKLDNGSYQPSNTFNNVGIGSHTVTIKDNNGCEKTSAAFTITQPVAVSLNAVPSPSCTNSATGSITATGNGGTGAYTYSINASPANTSGAASGIFTNLSNGTYIVMVTDANMCTATKEVTVASTPLPVCDITGNTSTCPGSINNTYSNSEAGTHSWSIGGNGTINGSTTGTSVNITAGPACGQSFTLTHTLTANGCSNTCILEVNVVDETAPTITKEAESKTVECDGQGNSAALQDWLDNHAGATATDNCSGVTWTNNFGGNNVLSDLCGATGAVTVEFTATDACGKTSKTTATFTIEDSIAPTITKEAESKTVECDGQGNSAALQAWLDNHAGATAIDNCSGVTWTNNFGGNNVLSDLCGATGAVTLEFTATDACGKTSKTTATFTIEDSIAPTITKEAESKTVECDGQGNSAALQAWLDNNAGATATDNCSGVTWTNNFGGNNVLSDLCGATGAVTVEFTATDACGNTSKTTATFTIEDTTAPTISKAAADLKVACDGNGNQTALNTWLENSGGAEATDACSGVTWTNNYGPNNSLSDLCGATGAVTVEFTATDACGNTSKTTATFTIEDTTAPTITKVAADLKVACDGNGNQTALNTWLENSGGAEATDACSGVTWTNNYGPNNSLSDLCGATGAVTVEFTATDACGNTSKTTATFTIEDTTAPTISKAAADLKVACDGNGNQTALNTWLENSGGAEATDACSGVTWTNNYGPNNSLSDLCGATGAVTVEFTAADACGNTSKTTATFTIEDTTAPTISKAAADLKVACDGNDNQTALNTWLENSGGAEATDACSGVTWTNNYGPNNSLSDLCGATGAVTVEFTATDACGNTSKTTATFTIEDTTAPNITTQAQNQQVPCGPNNAQALQTWLNNNGNAVASDNCSAVTWTNNYTALSDLCGATGEATVIFTASDACGNTSTTQATFRIVDTTPPVLTGTLPANQTNLGCSPTQTYVGPTEAEIASQYTDACGSVTVTKSGGELVISGCNWSQTFRYVVSDACGNSLPAINIVFSGTDNIAPTFTKPADITIEKDPNNCTYNVATNITGTASNIQDNCSTATASYTDVITSSTGDPCNNDQTTLNHGQGIYFPITLSGYGTKTAGQILNVSLSFSTNQGKGNQEFVLIAPNGSAVVLTGPICAGGFCESATSQKVTYSPTFYPGAATAGRPKWLNSNNIPVGAGDFVPTGGANFANDGIQSGLSFVDKLENLTGPMNGTWRIYGYKSVDGNGDIKFLGACLGVPVVCSDVVIKRTWRATDACNNVSAGQVQTITIKDVSGPKISTAASNLVLQCGNASNSSAVASWLASNGGAIASDACGGEISWTNDGGNITLPGSCGTINVTFTVSDICGNTSETKASIIVEDKITPTVTCPVNIISENPQNAQCSYTISGFTLNTSDNCSQNLSVSYSIVRPGSPTASVVQDLNGQEFTKGVSTITISVADGCGNTSTCAFSVIVRCETDIVCTFWSEDYAGENLNPTCGEFGYDDIQNAMLYSLNGSPYTFGSPTNGFTLTPTDISSGAIQTLMANGVAPLPGSIAALPAGTASSSNPGSLIQGGVIQNPLLIRTMALYFNLQNSISLDNVPLTNNMWTKQIDCATGQPFGPNKLTQVPDAVVSYLFNVNNGYVSTSGSQTIADLYDLANDVLGGKVLGTPSEVIPSLEQIKIAVENINDAFRNCSVLVAANINAIGTIYNDIDGMDDGKIDFDPGSPLNGIDPQTGKPKYFLTLIEGSAVDLNGNSTGPILKVSPINATGNYLFDPVVDGTYTINFGDNPLGNRKPVAPAGKVFSAEGGNVVAGFATGDGNPNGRIVMTVSDNNPPVFQALRVAAPMANLTDLNFGIAPTSLPVRLISFIGKATDAGNELTWKASSEQNFSHYEVEKSTDSRAFKQIAKVNSMLYVSESLAYTYVDKGNTTGQLPGANTPATNESAYYRLKMVDIDGKFEYSKIVYIKATDIKQATVSEVYPNPSKGSQTYIDVVSTANTDWTISTYDMAGRLINTERKRLEVGLNKVPISLSKLNAGTNIIKLENADGNYYRKAIINN